MAYCIPSMYVYALNVLFHVVSYVTLPFHVMSYVTLPFHVVSYVTLPFHHKLKRMDKY